MFTNVHPIPQEAHIVVNYARCAFGLKLFATRYNNVVQIVLKLSESCLLYMFLSSIDFSMIMV